MNTLAHELPAMRRWRLAEWAAQAWRRMGWRHLFLALALQIARQVFGPLGGVFLYPTGVPENWDVLFFYLNGQWAVHGLLIIYCVLVADEAFDDGVPPLRAYGLAVIALAALCSIASWFIGGHMGWARLSAPQRAWWVLALLFQGGLGVSIYAYWRVTQRALRRAESAETERVRNEQRIQTARLLTLQSRVEPQMLFDALRRVGELHAHEPQAADARLADLIALLRAMQLGASADNSTVEREFALVEAWARVTCGTTPGGVRVRLTMTRDTRSIGIAPMLVLPLLRTVLVLPGATKLEWLLSAHLANHRLIVTLQSSAGNEVPGLLARADLSALKGRLTQLFGRSAGLAVSSRSLALTLDLPQLQEDPDDDRADR